MKLFKHLNTVRKHRKEVRKLCFKCGIYKQGLLHDLSKYSLVELIPSAKYWTGKKSPIDVEIAEKGYSEAWLHHKGRNKHHYEYWLDPVHNNGAMIEIPTKYLAEMFCDRVAATKVYQGADYKQDAPLAYLKSRTHERNLMHEDTYGMLFQLMDLLARWGEDETCKHIRSLIDHEKEDRKHAHQS